MKILQVIDSVSPNGGGITAAVHALAQALLRSGVIEIPVHAIADGASADKLPQWAPVRPETHPAIGPRQIGFSRGLERALFASQADAIHVHGIWQVRSASVHRAHRLGGVPYLISPHGMLDPWALDQSRWKKRLASALYERRHLRSAACLHALCSSESDSIRAYGLRNPVCIIPNGVELPEIADPRSRAPGGGPDKKLLLFLGRLHPKKGLVNALRAWHARQTRDGWQFAIAGWDQGGHEAELKRLCDELGLPWAEVPAADFLERTSDPRSPAPDPCPEPHASCLFLGPAFGREKDRLLRSADAFILPSFSEGLPMAVLEAWAYGLPVLMTEACNLPEGFAADAALRIGTDVGGQRSEVGGNALPMDEGLRVLMEMGDGEREAMGARGRRLVEERFTWPQVAAQMLEVYEWVLGGGSRPGCVED